jgi:hypothetical protein
VWADGQLSGNSVAAVQAPFATDLAEAKAALFAVRDATRDAKTEFKRMPTSLNRAISSVGMYAVSLIQNKPNTDPDKASFTNLTISNVPGPKQRIYFNGAGMDGMYPVSVLASVQRLAVNLPVALDREEPEEAEGKPAWLRPRAKRKQKDASPVRVWSRRDKVNVEEHLIEGLEGGRYAVYTTLHHSQFDGKRGLELVKHTRSSRAQAQGRTPNRCSSAPSVMFSAISSRGIGRHQCGLPP